MEAALAIKAVIALVAFAAWLIGKMKGPAVPAPMAATPPPPARRARRVRNAPAPVAAAPEPTTPAPVAAPHLDASSLVVTRPARAHARAQFRGAAALRQAVVAREVLGLPLSLRPPRF
jgi:hypothetical protein